MEIFFYCEFRLKGMIKVGQIINPRRLDMILKKFVEHSFKDIRDLARFFYEGSQA